MSHTKATPEHQRPTLDEMEVLDRFAQKHTHIHVIIRGLWEDSEAPFEVVAKGHFDDVVEVFETLKDNGNLIGIEMHEIGRTETQ